MASSWGLSWLGSWAQSWGISSTPPVVEEEYLGRAKHYSENDPYNVRVEKKELEENIIKVETNIIDLKQREQELRLRQLAIQKAQDRAEKRELERLVQSILFIQEQIEIEKANLVMLQNNMAMLVLIMAYPYLRIGGVKTIM